MICIILQKQFGLPTQTRHYARIYRLSLGFAGENSSIEIDWVKF